MRASRRVPPRRYLLCAWATLFMFVVAYFGVFGTTTFEAEEKALPNFSFSNNTLDWDAEKEAVLRDNSFLEISVEAANVLQKLNEPYWRKHRLLYGEPGDRFPIEKKQSFHIFYTVDCTQHSVWQSIALEKSWEEVRQPGALTRIIGNCVNIKGRIASTIERVNRTIAPPTAKSFLFYAPAVNTKINGDNYSPLNRPSSVFYWLSNADPQEEVFALVDPDMIFLKPLTHYELVRPGQPFGQYYGYMEHRDWYAHYHKVCTTTVYTGKLISGEKDCTAKGPRKAWATGPPHYMSRDDWYVHVLWWLRYTVGMKINWGDWVSEMAGFSSALITMNVHTRTMSGITWERASDVNRHIFANLVQPAEGQLDTGIESVPTRYLPYILHYCVTFEVGRHWNPQSLWRYAAPQVKWEQENLEPLMLYMHWSKYRVPTDWGGVISADSPVQKTLLDCEQPLLLEYPSLTRMLSFYKGKWNSEDRAWYFFFVSVIPAINRALVKYKTKYCTNFNDALLWRTAHDQKWMSHYYFSPNASDPRGFSYRRVE
eukprot:TRINITY_DN16185_c0_g1_i1.p1 TRINITY_DN16185_c0_g1~~TRINITY_DN16185_c0_g1_i1.p1  ORF type:complete len:540 (+),score=51.29 TRINITY_DN16185_c0_g1_i1:23-1642(+)